MKEKLVEFSIASFEVISPKGYSEMSIEAYMNDKNTESFMSNFTLEEILYICGYNTEEVINAIGYDEVAKFVFEKGEM